MGGNLLSIREGEIALFLLVNKHSVIPIAASR